MDESKRGARGTLFPHVPARRKQGPRARAFAWARTAMGRHWHGGGSTAPHRGSRHIVARLRGSAGWHWTAGAHRPRSSKPKSAPPGWRAGRRSPLRGGTRQGLGLPGCPEGRGHHGTARGQPGRCNLRSNIIVAFIVACHSPCLPALAAPSLFAGYPSSRTRRGRCPFISRALAHRQPRVALEARIRLRPQAAPELAPARVPLHTRVLAFGTKPDVWPLHPTDPRNSA